jgi:hypothetical protein
VTQYWFKPKRYGYGATPVTWQGWAVTFATVLAMVAVNVGLRLAVPHYWAFALAFDALALAFLFMVCRRKTQGEWRWRWGDR